MSGVLTQAERELAEVVKRRRRKERAARDLPADGETAVTTGARDQAEGYRRAMADEAAAKAYEPLPEPAMPAQQDEAFAQDHRAGYQEQGHGAESPQSGPPCGYPVAEGQPQPGAFDRGYAEPGHAANSPQAGRSPENPIMHAPPGILRPVTLPDAPMSMRIPQHVAASYTMGSPSEHAR
jgi:hypothetical protein